jgi:glycosyltransferase involved in cell wall biosynthesis
MKILVTLPIQHPLLTSLDEVISGKIACSGTIGSILRLADMLMSENMQVTVSSTSKCQSTRLHCLQHSEVDAMDFDKLIIHQSHWDGDKITFGNTHLRKTILYLHNQTTWGFINSFFQSGGYRLVCPSMYLANFYRALPEWIERIAIISNSYSPVFFPISDSPKKRLLFIGAITPSKGFNELMQIWSYLVDKGVDLQFAIAGGISLHRGDIKTGALGIADEEYEVSHIHPWYQSLPESYRPQLLGALSPIDLQKEITQSWAVIVNPSWHSLETFACSAVESQACNLTVFSVNAGGLKETVYQGEFPSITSSRTPEALGDLIIQGLNNPKMVAKNGQLAGEFVRRRFSAETISNAWLDLLAEKAVQPQSFRSWDSPATFLKDLMRWTGTGMLLKTIYGKLRDRPV